MIKILINYYYNINVFEVYYLIIGFTGPVNNLFIK